MAFAAILGLAGAGIGAFAQMSAANQAADMAYYQMQMQERQFQKQYDLQVMNMGMARDARRDQQENNEYLRQIEQMNRLIMQGERTFSIEQTERMRAQQLEERQYIINRQIQLDREAARTQAMQIEQMMRNQQLAQEERQFAIEQLRQAQAVARGERDEDLKRFYEERETRSMERNFAVDQYRRMQFQAQQERAVEMDRRNRVTGQIDNLRNSLAAAFDQLGPMPQRPGVTREEIDADARRREDIYMSDVDRAADRVASVNEADLIRRGVDASTGATQRRGEITERVAQEYNRARERARDEALRYIAGIQGTLFNEYNAAMGERERTLQEVLGVQGVGIDQLMSLPNLPSAVMNDYLNMPSAVYNRDIRSANQYASPVPITSGIFQGSFDPAMANTLTPSPVTAFPFNAPSAVYGPAQLNLNDPAAFMNIAGIMGSNMLNNRTANVDSFFKRADNASAGAMASFQNLLRQAGGFNWGSFGGGGMTANGLPVNGPGHILPPPRP